MSDLIAELKSVAVGNKTLDWRIHSRNGLDGIGSYHDCPRYTTDMNAALTLIPDDWLWSCGKRVNAPGYVVSLDNYGHSVTAMTPALAICAAYLSKRRRVKS